MKLILVTKPDMKNIELDNVVQLDLCNMAQLDDDISDGDWNFISITIKYKFGLEKRIFKLENIWQFSLIREDKEKINE